MRTFYQYFARLTALTLTLFLALPTVTVVHAQSLPSCSDQAFDVDGDGFGWENNASCIVDQNTTPPPIVINQSTGAQVTLVRANWDASADIAGRTIQCDRFDFDARIGNYVTPDTDFTTPTSYTLTHDSLLPVQRDGFNVFARQGFNLSGWYTLRNLVFNRTIETNTPPFWTVEDGLYVGDELLTERYIELVKTPDNFDAIRIWYEQGEGFPINSAFEWRRQSYVSDGYYQCFDQAGADFTPTRTLGVPGPVIQPELSKIALTVEANPNFTSGEIVNLQTGEIVPQVKAHWNYNNDLAGRNIFCKHFIYDEIHNDNPGYVDAFSARVGRPDSRHFYFAPLEEGSDTTAPYWSQYQSGISNPFLEINDGMIKYQQRDIFASDKVELIGNDRVRVWIDPSAATGMITSQYYECNAQPTGSANALTVDDSDSIVPMEVNLPVDGDTPGDSDPVIVVSVDEMTDVANDVDAESTTDDSDGEQTNVTPVDNETDNVEDGSVSIVLDSSDESTSQSGGGSFWLPLLIFALALRRSLHAIKSDIKF